MILFLDFDGVLHPYSRPSGVLALVPYFERFMRNYPYVKIVISSAWREVHTLQALRSFFSEDIAKRIIDVTPQFDNFDHEFIREAEIRAWLHATGRMHEPWVAIDDMPEFFSPDCGNLVVVDTDIGFNESTEQELIKRFLASR
jgi:hypothetical protein